MHTHNFPAAKIKVQYVKPDPMLVGPVPHGLMSIWGKLVNIKFWPAWVIGVDKVLAGESNTMARGSLFEVVGIFGAGKIEILRWAPETELVLLLQTSDLRLAFSILLDGGAGDAIIDVEGEYELTGWKSAFRPILILLLRRRQRKMIDKLNFLLNQPSSTH